MDNVSEPLSHASSRDANYIFSFKQELQVSFQDLLASLRKYITLLKRKTLKAIFPKRRSYSLLQKEKKPKVSLISQRPLEEASLNTRTSKHVRPDTASGKTKSRSSKPSYDAQSQPNTSMLSYQQNDLQMAIDLDESLNRASSSDNDILTQTIKEDSDNKQLPPRPIETTQHRKNQTRLLTPPDDDASYIMTERPYPDFEREQIKSHIHSMVLDPKMNIDEIISSTTSQQLKDRLIDIIEKQPGELNLVYHHQVLSVFKKQVVEALTAHDDFKQTKEYAQLMPKMHNFSVKDLDAVAHMLNNLIIHLTDVHSLQPYSDSIKNLYQICTMLSIIQKTNAHRFSLLELENAQQECLAQLASHQQAFTETYDIPTVLFTEEGFLSIVPEIAHIGTLASESHSLNTKIQNETIHLDTLEKALDRSIDSPEKIKSNLASLQEDLFALRIDNNKDLLLFGIPDLWIAQAIKDNDDVSKNVNASVYKLLQYGHLQMEDLSKHNIDRYASYIFDSLSMHYKNHCALIRSFFINSFDNEIITSENKQRFIASPTCPNLDTPPFTLQDIKSSLQQIMFETLPESEV